MRQSASTSSVGLRPTRRSLTRWLWCDESLPADIAAAWLSGDAERLLRSSVPLQVKDRCIVVRHDHPAGPLLLKRHTWGGFSRTLRSLGREAAARKCGRLGLFLHQLGIPTPLPRACFEQRLGPWNLRSYLVTDYVEGTSLYRYVRFGSQPDDELREIARQVARIWQQLVDSGISHNDMKPENFIVDEDRRVWLIDLEKMRIGEKAARQRRRNIFEVKNFLHVRGWHRRDEARKIFFDEFLRTPHGYLLSPSAIAGDVDNYLSVLIVCNGRASASIAQRAIESVRDIADEVVLVGCSGTGKPEVSERIVLCGEEPATLPLRSVAHYPWVLVLRQNEIVTPVLVKELGEHIVDAQVADAFRIPIESGKITPAIRLFRQDRCPYSLSGGNFAITQEPARTGQLTGAIEQFAAPAAHDVIAPQSSRRKAA